MLPFFSIRYCFSQYFLAKLFVATEIEVGENAVKIDPDCFMLMANPCKFFQQTVVKLVNKIGSSLIEEPLGYKISSRKLGNFFFFENNFLEREGFWMDVLNRNLGC